MQERWRENENREEHREREGEREQEGERREMKREGVPLNMKIGFVHINFRRLDGLIFL